MTLQAFKQATAKIANSTGATGDSTVTFRDLSRIIDLAIAEPPQAAPDDAHEVAEVWEYDAHASGGSHAADHRDSGSLNPSPAIPKNFASVTAFTSPPLCASSTWKPPSNLWPYLGPQAAPDDTHEVAEVWAPQVATAAVPSIFDRIAAERAKQIAKGWTAEHDDTHEDGELALNAAFTALIGTRWNVGRRNAFGDEIPDSIFDCAQKDRGKIRNLIVAAAFLVAEIERIERRDGVKVSPSLPAMQTAAESELGPAKLVYVDPKAAAAEIERLQMKLEKARIKIYKVAAAMTPYLQELHRAGKTGILATDAVAMMVADRNELKSKLEDAEKERDALKARIAQLEKELAAADKGRDSLDAACKTARRDYDAVKSERDESRRGRTNALTRVAELEADAKKSRELLEEVFHESIKSHVCWSIDDLIARIDAHLNPPALVAADEVAIFDGGVYPYAVLPNKKIYFLDEGKWKKSVWRDLTAEEYRKEFPNERRLTPDEARATLTKVPIPPEFFERAKP